MKWQQLHKVQASVLYTLRRAQTARFSELMQPTGLQSDSFKFYLRELVKEQLVSKREDGSYQLTAMGKEFANNLDEAALTRQKQPKLSLILVVSRRNDKNETKYLFQQRLRHPFYGYWGHLSGPAVWGVSFEETAAAELFKQTGLSGNFTVGGFHRAMDHKEASEEILEDKLFIIMEATVANGELSSAWSGGYNEWMSIAELKQQEKYFALTEVLAEMLYAGKTYTSKAQAYKQGVY